MVHKDSVHTSQETHYISATKPNRLMLFRETVAVYCENHKKHTHPVRRMKSSSMLKHVIYIATTGL
jgi:thioredoxin-related protein